LGTLPAKTDHVRFTQRVSCGDTCHVTGVWTSTLPGASIDGAVTLRNLTAKPSGEVVPLGPAQQWTEYRDPDNGRVVPSGASADALTVTFEGKGATVLTMQQRWL